MSQQRPRRNSLPPERFRSPSVDPPQHEVTRARPVSALVPARPCVSPPSPPCMDAPRVDAPRPPPQDPQLLPPPAPAQIIQHVHQQLFFSAVPTAVARPVLPAEDLWSLEGLRAHASASARPATAPAKWHHGKRSVARERTALLPAAPSRFSPPLAPPPLDAQRPTAAHSAGASSSAALVPTLSGPSPPQPAVSGLVAEVLAYAASQNRAAVAAVVAAGAADAPSPVTTICAPPPASSLVHDVLAYAASQSTAVAGVECASGSAPVPVAASSSSLVCDVLAYARAEADKVAAAEFVAAKSAYAEGMARVRLLERAGRSLDALELSKSLVPPPPPPPMASRTLSPPVVRPVGASSIAPGAPRVRAVAPPSVCALDDWRSLVDASNDPSSVATTSPVHVILEGMRDLNPGARRARAVAVVAAARLVPFMTIEMIAAFLGCPQSELRALGPAFVAADAVRVISSGWSASLLSGARSTWLRLLRFAAARGRVPSVGQPRISGYVVRDFLDEVDRRARGAYESRGRPLPGDAKGSTARRGAASHLTFLASKLSFPVDMSSASVQRALAQTRKRLVPKSAPPLGIRMLCVLSWLTQYGQTQFVRGHAAAWLAMAMFSTRFVNAQRARLVSVQDGVVFAVCDLDAKAAPGSQEGRPMWTSTLDPMGSAAWIDELVAMRDSDPRASSSDPSYFLRETNSPDGDPARASAWLDEPCPNGRRAMRSLRSLGTMSPWALPAKVLASFTGHSPRHDLPNVSRAGGDSLADTNELGRWSGCRSCLPVDADDSLRSGVTAAGSSAPRKYAMPALYSAAAAAEVVPAIVERQLQRLRAVVAARGPANLPLEGGWSLIRDFERSRLSTGACNKLCCMRLGARRRPTVEDALKLAPSCWPYVFCRLRALLFPLRSVHRQAAFDSRLACRGGVRGGVVANPPPPLRRHLPSPCWYRHCSPRWQRPAW